MSFRRGYFHKRKIAEGSLLACFLFGLLLGQACSPLRNLEKNRLGLKAVSDSSLRAVEFTKTQEKASSLHLVQDRDSLDAAYHIEIWPDGAFSYDPVAGFKGEAAKIEILGRQTRRSSLELAHYRESSKDQQLKRSLDVEQHSQVVEKEQSKQKAVSWKTLLGYFLIAFCLLAAFLLYRGIRSRRFI